MNNIIRTLDKIEKLNETEMNALNQLGHSIRYTTLKKGQFLFHTGDMPDFVVYVDSGLLRRMITDSNENDRITRFYKEEDFIHDCHCYYEQKPVDYAVQAIENCELSYFKLPDMEHLANDFPVFEKIGRKMLEGHLTNQTEHIELLMKYSPEERYKYLLENNPDLIQRLSVTHLAQYLAISRETLSRMRAKVFENHIL